MRKRNWSTLIRAPYAGTDCTCLPGFGVQFSRIRGDMPSFLNCCHVLRMKANKIPFFASMYLYVQLQYTIKNPLQSWDLHELRLLGQEQVRFLGGRSRLGKNFCLKPDRGKLTSRSITYVVKPRSGFGIAHRHLTFNVQLICSRST